MSIRDLSPFMRWLRLRMERRPGEMGRRKTVIEVYGQGPFKDLHERIWNTLEGIERSLRKRKRRGEPELDVDEGSNVFVDLDGGILGLSKTPYNPKGRKFEVEHKENVNVNRITLGTLLDHLRGSLENVEIPEDALPRDDIHTLEVYKHPELGFVVRVVSREKYTRSILDEIAQRSGSSVRKVDSGVEKIYILGTHDENKMKELLLYLLLRRNLIYV